jgi:hypothetical protein
MDVLPQTSVPAAPDAEARMLWLQASPTRSMALNAVALGLLTHATEQKQPKG